MKTIAKSRATFFVWEQILRHPPRMEAFTSARLGLGSSTEMGGFHWRALGEIRSSNLVCSMLPITTFLLTRSPPTSFLLPDSETVQSISLSAMYLGLKTRFLRLCG